MEFIGHFKGLYCISAGSWLIFGLYSISSIKKFIIKRYEEETNLLGTAFFREHFAFAPYQPSFFSSGLYAAHLLMCIWGWQFFKGRVFIDIASPDIITQHFTEEEISRVKRLVFVFLIIFLHLIGMELINWIRPGTFI